MAQRRRDRVRASQRALAAMPAGAAKIAVRKARAEGRTYPTSQQRARALEIARRG